MIKDSPIVEDIRRIRNKISEKFDHDIDRYIAYLHSEAASRQAKKPFNEPIAVKATPPRSKPRVGM